MQYYVGDTVVDINRKKDFIGQGLESFVYKKDNYVLKIYKSVFGLDNYEDRDFKLQLSQLDTKRIIMPKEMVYKTIKKDDNKHYTGYTSSYIEPGNNPISEIKTYKMLDNFYCMNEDFELLNKENILANDTHLGNIVFDKNGNMFIVDIGYFSKAFFPPMVKSFNKRSLDYMVKCAIVENSNVCDKDSKRMLYEYLSLELYGIDTLKFLENNLIGFDTLGEYQEYLKKKLIRRM